ncbi:MAG: hypothetical protein SGARI_003835 [Bacillariaceae sp.]
MGRTGAFGGGGGGMEATEDFGGAEGGGGTGEAAAGPLVGADFLPLGEIFGVGFATKDSEDGGAL